MQQLKICVELMIVSEENFELAYYEFLDAVFNFACSLVSRFGARLVSLHNVPNSVIIYYLG